MVTPSDRLMVRIPPFEYLPLSSVANNAYYLALLQEEPDLIEEWKGNMNRIADAAAAVALALGLPCLAVTQDHTAGAGSGGAAIEVPLRVDGGRLVVSAQDDTGGSYDFVVGLGPMLLTTSGAERVGGAVERLTLGGTPIVSERVQTVPDSYLAGTTAVGVIGGETLNGFDLLIDVPGGRLVLKPIGRSVRWDGVALSSPVRLQVFHDVLLRADVDFGGHVVGGLLDLAQPHLEVNEALSPAVEGGAVTMFRMGYHGWTDLPARVTDSPTLRGWDRAGNGFVIVGAPVAFDCALAISWAHAELRTCLQ